MDVVSEWKIFKLLDALPATATFVVLAQRSTLFLQANNQSVHEVYINFNSSTQMEKCLDHTRSQAVASVLSLSTR